VVNKKNTPSSNWTVSFIAILFILGGLFVATFMVRQLTEMFQVSNYQRVSATVEEVRLSSGSKGGMDLSVRYRYQWAGRDFEGRRVTPMTMVSKGEQEAWHDRLKASMEKQESVPAWLDPSQPEKVMLDKTVSWSPVFFMSIFVLTFPAMGIWLLKSHSTSKSTPEPQGFAETAPEAAQPAQESTNSLEQVASSTDPRLARRFLLVAMALAFCSGAFWIYNTWPADYQQIIDAGGGPLRFMRLIFPAFGLFMLVPVWRFWRAYRKLPETRAHPMEARPPELQQSQPITVSSSPLAGAPGQVSSNTSPVRLGVLLFLLALACLIYLQKDAVLAWAHGKGWLPAPPAQEVRLPELPPLKQADQALIDAAQQGDAEGTAQALNNGANVNVYDNTGESALLQAAALGHLEVVRTLLQKGADLQFTNSVHPHQKGDTALLRAAYRGHAEVFELLLKAGAHADVKNQWGWSAVHMAAAGDCTPCLEALAPRQLPLDEAAHPSRGETPFLMAAGKDATQAMAWLKDHGANTSAKDDHHYDALGWARFYKAQASEAWLKANVPTLTGQSQ